MDESAKLYWVAVTLPGLFGWINDTGGQSNTFGHPCLERIDVAVCSHNGTSKAVRAPNKRQFVM
jgi:hypothetical protein